MSELLLIVVWKFTHPIPLLQRVIHPVLLPRLLRLGRESVLLSGASPSRVLGRKCHCQAVIGHPLQLHSVCLPCIPPPFLPSNLVIPTDADPNCGTGHGKERGAQLIAASSGRSRSLSHLGINEPPVQAD